MIGLVLVTHGRLAAEFVAAMEHVVGPQAQCLSVCIEANDDMEERRADIARAAAEVDKGDGVILLTDMFGGTPSNLAISLLGRPNLEVIAGVNLPMLIKVFTSRDKELEEVARSAGEAGAKGIVVAGSMLRNKARDKADS